LPACYVQCSNLYIHADVCISSAVKWNEMMMVSVMLMMTVLVRCDGDLDGNYDSG
jgi:hypothetical protein